MEEGNRNLDLQDDPMDEADQEKMQRDVVNLLRQSESCMFTIQVAPGTTMHINIAPETEPSLVPSTSSWCISTLIVHNGQHYTNTIHNFTVNRDLMQNLESVLMPDTVAGHVQLLQQLMARPLDLPRHQPMQIAAAVSPARAYVQPTAIRSMVQHYCNYVMRTARILDNVFGWVTPSEGAAVQDLRRISQSLQTMLERVQRSLQVAEQLFSSGYQQQQHQQQHQSQQQPQQQPQQQQQQQQQHSEEQTDEDLSSELEVETEDDDTDTCGPEEPDFMRFDEYDDSQINCDEDEESTSSESDIHSSIFLGPDFEEFPSLTISEDENEEEQGDEESWESDFEDDESFDAYMVRQLRAHGTGLLTRRNFDWVNLVNETTQADINDWELGSCSSNCDLEDIRSELSCSSEDLNAWQYNEDREFETELSRPLRRLVGDLPAQTAQEERYAWRHSLVNFDLGRGLLRRPSYRYYPEEPTPPSSYNHWRPQETLGSSSDSSPSESPGRCGRAYTLSFYSNGLDSMDSDTEPDEIDMEVDADTEVPSDEQPILPLETFLHQTDELIAQLRAKL